MSSTETLFTHAAGGSSGLVAIGSRSAACGETIFPLPPLELEPARQALRLCTREWNDTLKRFEAGLAPQSEMDTAETVMLLAENNFIEAMRAAPFRKGTA